jgi:hypothetical protein
VMHGSGRGGHHPETVPGCVLDEDGHDVTGGVGVEMAVRQTDSTGSPDWCRRRKGQVIPITAGSAAIAATSAVRVRRFE